MIPQHQVEKIIIKCTGGYVITIDPKDYLPKVECDKVNQKPADHSEPVPE